MRRQDEAYARRNELVDLLRDRDATIALASAKVIEKIVPRADDTLGRLVDAYGDCDLDIKVRIQLAHDLEKFKEGALAALPIAKDILLHGPHPLRESASWLLRAMGKHAFKPAWEAFPICPHSVSGVIGTEFFRKKSIITELISYVDSGSKNHARAAIGILSRLDADAEPAIPSICRRLLESHDAMLSEWTVIALCDLGRHIKSDLICQTLIDYMMAISAKNEGEMIGDYFLSEAMKEQLPLMMTRLREIQQTGTPWQRKIATQAISAIRPIESDEQAEIQNLLSESIDDAEPNVSLQAIEGLADAGPIKDQAIIFKLIEKLRFGLPLEQGEAAHTLEEYIGNPSVETALIAALNDPNYYVRFCAAEAVGKSRGAVAKANDRLVELLKKPPTREFADTPNDAVKLHIFQRNPQVAAAEALCKADGISDEVRDGCFQILRCERTRVNDSFLSQMKIRIIFLLLAQRGNDDSVMNIFLEIYPHESIHLRSAMMSALDKIRSKLNRFFPLLKLGLTDHSRWPIYSVCKTIRRHKTECKPLLPLLRRLLKRKNEQVRCEAAATILCMEKNNSMCRDILRKAAKHPDSNISIKAKWLIQYPYE